MAAKETTREAVEQPLTVEQQLELRQQLDRILGAILAEPDADFRPVGMLYQEFAVRCRIEGLAQQPPISVCPAHADMRQSRSFRQY